MNQIKLKQAVKEAKRFLKRAKVLRKAVEESTYPFPKEQGAVRRSSMDLTRSLAELRAPE